MKREEVLERVRKLMALGDRDRNPNQAEAEAALDRAQELIARWNIENQELRHGPAARGFKYSVIVERRGRTREEPFVAHILEKFFQVLPLEKGSRAGRVVSLFGTEPNVQAAELVWHYLARTYRALWRRCRKAWGPEHIEQRAFYWGVTAALEKKLAAARARQFSDADRRALVQVGRDLRKAFTSTTGVEIRENQPKPDRKPPDERETLGWLVGQIVGEEIEIRPGLAARPARQALPQQRSFSWRRKE
ncbi:MAG TPA: DUF2786 domain-containing protein [Phycisphaerae bacterium]|nr:DUF2786 domain-containing protein [Phycisphaerae bacterium]